MSKSRRGPIERRIFSHQITTRSNPDGTVGLRGYFAIFDSPAHGEVIERSAFNRTIAQADDVRLLTNHDGVPMARTKSGTLALGVDSVGGWWDAPSLDPANPDVARMLSAVERGDIDQCSFAGYWLDAPNVDGLTRVREVALVDVSIVTYPWYEDTSVTMTGSRNEAMLALATRSLPPEERPKLSRLLRAAPPGREPYGDRAELLCDAITDLLPGMSGVDECYVWIWIDDLGDDWCVYSVAGSDCYMQVDYTFDGTTITLGMPFEVERVTQYVPCDATTPDPDAALDAPGDRKASLSTAEARALLGLPPAA